MISLLSQKLSKFNLFLKTKAPKQEATYEICIYILNSNMQDSIVLLYTMSMKCLGEALLTCWGLGVVNCMNVLRMKWFLGFCDAMWCTVWALFSNGCLLFLRERSLNYRGATPSYQHHLFQYVIMCIRILARSICKRDEIQNPSFKLMKKRWVELAYA